MVLAKVIWKFDLGRAHYYLTWLAWFYELLVLPNFSRYQWVVCVQGYANAFPPSNHFVWSCLDMNHDKITT